MHLSNVLLLLANTSRTRVYVQAIQNSGITVGKAIVYGPDTGLNKDENQKLSTNWKGSPVFLPQKIISLDSTLKKICKKHISLKVTSVNEEAVLQAINLLQPELIVYSGFGGQIVSKHLLNTGIPFLHMHAGWLPEFRGSTTTYYHIIKSGFCAVSAILLKPQIDTGPILARKKYPKPPLGINIDLIYDNAIRADLLVYVLKQYYTNKHLPHLMQQNIEDGHTYYIIHPILKHVAFGLLDE